MSGHNGDSPDNSSKSRVKDIYEPKTSNTLIRVLTVLAYLLSVSLAAIMLSIYYIFIWDAPNAPPKSSGPHEPSKPQPLTDLHGVSQNMSICNESNIKYNDCVLKYNINISVASKNHSNTDIFTVFIVNVTDCNNNVTDYDYNIVTSINDITSDIKVGYMESPDRKGRHCDNKTVDKGDFEADNYSKSSNLTVEGTTQHPKELNISKAGNQFQPVYEKKHEDAKLVTSSTDNYLEASINNHMPTTGVFPGNSITNALPSRNNKAQFEPSSRPSISVPDIEGNNSTSILLRKMMSFRDKKELDMV